MILDDSMGNLSVSPMVIKTNKSVSKKDNVNWQCGQFLFVVKSNGFKFNLLIGA